jgi:hypothetical protein
VDVETPSLQLADFMDLFSGKIHDYGQHIYAFDGLRPGQKEEGQSSTITNKLLTIEQYKAHLSGIMGLGIIPVDDKGEAKFGGIDIDVYDSSFEQYINAIELNNLPLVPFRSKSGGLHLFMFMEQRVSAKAIVELLKKQVILLGLDLYVKNKLNKIIEIFPKQDKTTPGKPGSWINLPYYNVQYTRQSAIRARKDLSLDEALAYAKSKRVNLTAIRTLLSEIPNSDGPPCLQTINLFGGPEKGGGRNNYLFSFGVYLKKKEPELWEQRLFELNSLMSEPLTTDELENTVISSLRKTGYTYRCNEVPCVDFCRKTLCKTRDFGIGKEGGYFSDLEYGKLVQIKANDPYYEWEVKLIGTEKFSHLRFKTEADIIGQDIFLRLCFRELHTLPVKIKQSEWYKKINEALPGMVVQYVEQEDDTSPIGIFKSLFVQFLTERAMAQTRDQVYGHPGRVYFDEKEGKNSYYFRTRDLTEYLFVTKLFKYYAPGEIHGLLHDFGAEPIRISTETSKQIRVYAIKQEDVTNIGRYKSEPFKAEFKKKDTEF